MGPRGCPKGALAEPSYAERCLLDALTRRTDLATRSKLPSASFTASEVGNAAAFSGLKTTTLDPAARRVAYFPRVNPPGKSERLYDRRISSLPWDLAFFIEPTFWACRRPRADEVDDTVLVGVGSRARSRQRFDSPKVIHRDWPIEWSGSAPVIAKGSASTVLADPFAITAADPDHSVGELRWITFGLSSRWRILAVVHTDEEDIIHLISARAATRPELRLYEEG